MQLRDLYMIFLQQNGYEVEVAVDGDQALEQAKAFEPDLVFLDIMLPKKDGFEVLKLLRHNPEYGCMRARIVMFTNLSDASRVTPEVRKDIDGYVVKAEIQLKDLVDVIKSLE